MMMFFGLIFLVLGGLVFLVLITALIAYFSGWRPDFLKQQSSEISSSEPGESALERLEQRYARGEIDEEQYLKMKRNLKS